MLKERLKKGVLEESNSSYRNKWFLVSKKDGGLRLINDAQEYNKFTIKDTFIPPSTDHFSKEFAICQILSLLDFFSGYDQVKLQEKSRDMTTFATVIGLFRLSTLPMGATNSIAQFMHVMARLLFDLVPHVCQAFLDDIAVKGPTTTYDDSQVPELPGVRQFVAKHIKNLDQVLLNAELAGATISAVKSEWCQKRVNIVGYTCETDGRSPQDSKIGKIQGWSYYSSLRDVKSFLGMVGYYSH